MRAGAEGLARVDDQVDCPVLRLRPGGPHKDAIADEHRLVEVLPAVGPVVGDLLGGDLHETLPHRCFEIGERGELARGAVDRVLHPAVSLLLLDPAGRKLDEVREHSLSEIRAATNRQADQ